MSSSSLGKQKRRGRSGAASLSRPGDPLVTAKGEVIQPDSRADIGLDDACPLDVTPSEFRAQRRQNIEDLPTDAHLMKACAVALAFTMLGISDREIQMEMRITEDQLRKVREHEAYADLFATFSAELINVNSMSLHARIAGMAHGALTRVALLARDAKKEETKLSANKDILDRAGTRIADQTEKNKGKSAGLRIVITEEGETTIDVTNVNVGGV